MGTGDTLAVLGLLERSWRYLQWGTKPGLTIAPMVGLEVPAMGAELKLGTSVKSSLPSKLVGYELGLSVVGLELGFIIGWTRAGRLRAYFLPSIKGTHMLLPHLEEIDFLIWLPWGDRPYWDC